MKRRFGKYQFEHICIIQPETENGQVKTYMPQSRYKNKKELPLNPYGAGPFCKFRIPKDIPYEGVYILTVDTAPFYVGECEELSQRYNTGYGQISPRNCYQGGQQTNCRINTLIYETVNQGSQIDLWFLRTPDYKDIESKLIQELNVRQRWNRKD